MLKYFTVSLLSLSSFLLNAQGYDIRVVSKDSDEGLPFAAVQIGPYNGFFTDEDGYIHLDRRQTADADTILISYVGFEQQSRSVSSLNAESLTLIPLQSLSDLPTITVTTPSAVFNRSLSVVSPKIEELERIPVLAGESDLLKALQLLPGVSGTIEGTADLSIRGGNTGQTHLIIDGNPIYNANHIGGFISSLPSFGVKRIDVYKGGIPARFGGRLSGVIDVQLREGRQDETRHELAIGTGLLRGGTEGPLGEHITYLAAARVAYPTLIQNLAAVGSYKKGESGSHEIFNLRDGIAKLSYDKNRLKATTSLFFSGDSGFSQDDPGPEQFTFEDFGWSSFSVAQQFRYQLDGGFIAKASLTYNQYGYNYFNRERTTENRQIQNSSGTVSAVLRDPGGRASLDYQITQNVLLSVGVDAIRHGFTHEQTATDESGVEIPDTLDLSQSDTEFNLYTQFRADLLNRRLQIQGGLRNSRLLGAGFSYLEPRVRIGYTFGTGLSLNAGLDYNNQFLHQVRADETIFPNELWLIASDNYLPARARQYFVGLATTLPWIDVNLAVEAFDKEMTGLTEASPFRATQSSTAADFLETLITNGEGRVQGLEFMAERSSECLAVSVSYTLSSSDRRYASLNDGEWFPYTFDKQHDLAITAGYQMKRNWFFTGTWVYQTGRAATVPVLTSPLNNIFSTINNARFAPFHRLNVGFEKTWAGKKRGGHEHVLTLSLYNAYNRENPYAMSFFPRSQTVQDPLTGEQVSVNRIEINTRSLLPIIPGISYRRKIR